MKIFQIYLIATFFFSIAIGAYIKLNGGGGYNVLFASAFVHLFAFIFINRKSLLYKIKK